jgi:GNAT superfamily N-acetyltransferase
MRGLMQIITDAYSDETRKMIEQMLSRHGSAAEHNYHCYINNIKAVSPDGTPIILLDDDYTGILASYEPENNDFRIFTEILAPKEKRAELLNKFLDYVFSLEKKPRKVWIELETDTRRNVVRALRHTPYKFNKINYTLIWPVFEMSSWNGDLMQGGEWKDLRYYWNRFFREHKVEFVTADKVSKEELKNLVIKWKKTRTTGDIAYIDYYIQAIEHDFEGYDVNRIMLVDGKVGAISAGFSVRKGYYYDSIGLYDTEIPRCNDIANMDDLINLKKLGYEIVDFGGIEKKSLEFKKKFRPTRYYKTHTFSIVLKDLNLKGELAEEDELNEKEVDEEGELTAEKSNKEVALAPKKVELMKIVKTNPDDWENIKKGILSVESVAFEEGIRYEEEDFDSFLLGNTSNYIVVDDATGEIVGYLMSCPIENDESYNEDEHFGKHDTIHLESIALAPACHGKGFGKMLFERFLSDSKDFGFKRVVLDATSPQMLGLALKHDFKKIKFYEEWQGGRSSWYMEKLI